MVRHGRPLLGANPVLPPTTNSLVSIIERLCHQFDQHTELQLYKRRRHVKTKTSSISSWTGSTHKLSLPKVSCKMVYYPSLSLVYVPGYSRTADFTTSVDVAVNPVRTTCYVLLPPSNQPDSQYFLFVRWHGQTQVRHTVRVHRAQNARHVSSNAMKTILYLRE